MHADKAYTQGYPIGAGKVEEILLDHFLATDPRFKENFDRYAEINSNAHSEILLLLRKEKEVFFTSQKLFPEREIWFYSPIRWVDLYAEGEGLSELRISGADLTSLLERHIGDEANYKENINAKYVKDEQNDIRPTLFQHPFGSEFARLSTHLTTRELSCLINFPQHSVPGISVVENWPDFSLTPQAKDGKARLELGKLVYDRKKSNVNVSVPIDTFCRHSLVAGVNGSGKTNTVLSVLEGFIDAGRPIMVFEPAKTEYVDWAIAYNKKIAESPLSNEEKRKRTIKIFIPGCDYYAKGKLDLRNQLGLRLNPFEVIKSKHEGNGYRVVSHLDKLKSVLAGAFPMQDILPTVIERLLYKLYMDTGWISEEEIKDFPSQFPTLTKVNQKFIKELMAELGYAEENTMNISAALRTRFNNMKYGWKGEMLCNERLNGQSWDELFNSPCIINLSYVGDDADKAFIMSLLMQYLYEYRIAESESEGYDFNDNACRHLVVVEEAHRVMNRCDNPEMPQYRSNQMFASILSEVRAYGQGVMVVDQVPSRLIEDAIKNTNVKIIHKIVADDDARMLAESVGLTLEQKDVIPKLSIGQAILVGLNSTDVLSPYASDIYLAQLNKKK